MITGADTLPRTAGCRPTDVRIAGDTNTVNVIETAAINGVYGSGTVSGCILTTIGIWHPGCSSLADPACPGCTLTRVTHGLDRDLVPLTSERMLLRQAAHAIVLGGQPCCCSTCMPVLLSRAEVAVMCWHINPRHNTPCHGTRMRLMHHVNQGNANASIPLAFVLPVTFHACANLSLLPLPLRRWPPPPCGRSTRCWCLPPAAPAPAPPPSSGVCPPCLPAAAPLLRPWVPCPPSAVLSPRTPSGARC